MGGIIPEESLTPVQRATLSNTICGDLESGRELEQMGLLEIRSIEQHANVMVAFFDLTDRGEAFVNRHFVIPDPPALRAKSE